MVQLTVCPIGPADGRLLVERDGRLEPRQLFGDLFPFPFALVVDSGSFETAFGTGRREADTATARVDERFRRIAERGGLRWTTCQLSAPSRARKRGRRELRRGECRSE